MALDVWVFAFLIMIIEKNISSKTDKSPLDVSTMLGDSKPNNVLNNQIIVGDQLGMPEDAQHRITFADFRKQAREF